MVSKFTALLTIFALAIAPLAQSQSVSPPTSASGSAQSNLRVPNIADDTAHGASIAIAPFWINGTTGDTFQLLSATNNAASWARLAPRYGLPLDIAGSNVTAAYSLYKIRAAYAGNAVQIERTSDTTTLNLGFVSTYVPGMGAVSYVDLASAAAFCSGTNCWVATWYDQSGNARNATQATLAQMPYFTINTLGNSATISFATQAVANAVSTVAKYLSLASGVSITNPNFGVAAVAQMRQQYGGSYLVNFGTANGSEISVGTSTQCSSPSPIVNPPVPMVGFSDQFGVHCGATYSESEPAVFGIFQDGTNVQTWVNENNSNTTKTTSTGGPYTGGFLGFESSFSVPYYGDMSTVILYTTSVTGATRTNLFNSLYRLHGITPQYAMNTWEVDGDSLAGGFGAQDDNGWQPLAAKQLNVRVTNTGTGGITCTTLDSQYTANIHPIVPTFGRNKVYHLYCGVNDLVAGTTAATIWSHIQSIIGKAALDWTSVIVNTVLPCNGQGSCTDVNYAALNALIRAGAVAAGATAVCDIAADSNMGQASQNSSTTYYLTDHLHPNDLGNAVIAQYAFNCASPILQK